VKNVKSEDLKDQIVDGVIEIITSNININKRDLEKLLTKKLREIFVTFITSTRGGK